MVNSVGNGGNLNRLFDTLAETLSQKNVLPTSTAQPQAATANSQTSLGDPNVQGWIDSFYSQREAENSSTGTAGGMSASTSYQPAPGAGSIYTQDTMYGPDQIYQQAIANQIGNSFAALTGLNAADLTSQLPGVPSEQAQKAFDGLMAEQNAQRLASGQPIDTSAYWSDPGSVTMDGTTYSAKELGYSGPAQSSGPEPIYISAANQVQGTDTFTVPGYEGTVKGIEPGKYYSLQQLEQAGLKSGQPDAQYHPGSWPGVVSA
jgi:hypothetical protein